MIPAILPFAALVVVVNGFTRMIKTGSVCIGGSTTSVMVGPCVLLDGEHFSNASFEAEFLRKTETDGSTAVAIGFQNTFKDGYVMGPKEPFEKPGKLELVPFVNLTHQYWTKEGEAPYFLDIRNEFNSLYINRDDSWVYQGEKGPRWMIVPCNDCTDDFGQEPFKSAEECLTQSFKFFYRLKTKGCMVASDPITFGLACTVSINGYKDTWSAVNQFSHEGINYFAISSDYGYEKSCLTTVDESGGGVQFVLEQCNKENHAQLWQFVDGPTFPFFGLRQFKSQNCIQPGKPGDSPSLEPCDSNNTDIFTGIRCDANIP